MTVFVVEQAPQTRTLKIMEEDGARSENYQLSFPYVVFFVTLRGRKSDEMYVFFRKEPLRNTKDDLLCAGLNNIHGDFSVCFSPSKAQDTLAQTAEESIANFWGGRFVKTHDPSNLASQISMEEWEKRTKKDSLFGLSFGWRASRLTVQKMLDTVAKNFAAKSAQPKKKGPDEKDIMSNLDTAVTKIAAKIETEIKEACFNLVPTWEVNETALGQVNDRLQEVVAELTRFAESKLGDDIDHTLSEDELKAVFEAAVKQVIDSTNISGGESIAAAEKALLDQFKEKK